MHQWKIIAVIHETGEDVRRKLERKLLLTVVSVVTKLLMLS